MRRSVALQTVIAILVVAAGLDAVAYAQRADACEYMSRPAAERPPCCAASAMDRLTGEGGDCCKELWLADSTPTSPRAESGRVPPAATQWIPRDLRWSEVAPSPRVPDAFRALVEHPPPKPPVLAFIVLRN